ncbi:MAG: aldose 1-epimerase family protein [Acidimicrobiales bacterium]|jgi:aldose 1-epimerase|nr:aldose 1-epimerase family protein [Actinomycetota bacterium]
MPIERATFETVGRWPDGAADRVGPTGRQWLIGHGHQQAVVCEVGATLRSYRVADRAILDGFEENEWSHDGRGQVLAPWPNRLGEGRYDFLGEIAQVPLDEPELFNAIHGLLRWLKFDIHARSQNVVLLGCLLYPTPAYPFTLEVKVEYRLGRRGLTVTTTASNAGDATLPFGLGFHPYLTAGTATIDTAILKLPAAERLVLDARCLPTGESQRVAGTEYDFTGGGRAIGPTRLDTAFGGLLRGDDGLAVACLEDPTSGQGVEIWLDDRFHYLMCYTGDSLGDFSRRRRSVAIEPMTCPPDAFRSGKDLIVLEPGQSWEASWGIREK